MDNIFLYYNILNIIIYDILYIVIHTIQNIYVSICEC